MNNNGLDDEMSISFEDDDDKQDGFISANLQRLSIKEVQALLAKYNKTIVDDDDPILLIVTMFNACFNEQEKLHEKHCLALSKVLGERTDSYIEVVRKSMVSLSESLSHATLKGMEEVSAKHKVEMEKLKFSLSISTAVNVIVLFGLVTSLILIR